jgi:hypothetical protein
MNPPKYPKIENIPILPGLGISLPFVAGNILHVRPRYGSDVNARPNYVERAFKTVAAAFANATANQNDVILFHAEGNAKADCSSTIASSLTWNKDLVHLIGVHSGVTISPRARLESSAAYASAIPPVVVSAKGCLFRGVEFILESTDGTCLGALKVTGHRNRFDRCHIYGFANAAQDIAGAYSLCLSAAQENEFEFCTIGSDRLAQGAQANSQLLMASRSCNNVFRDCIFKLVSTSATNHVFVRAAADSLDGALTFVRTIGVNSQSRNVSGLELTYAMVVASNAGGDVILDPGSAFQAADVNSTNAGNVYAAGAGAGILVPVTQ